MPLRYAPRRPGHSTGFACCSRQRLSWPVPGVLPQATDHRSPVAAGLFSFVLPFGTGSFYAGHRRHGVTHLAVGFVSFTTMFLGAVECIFTNIEGDGNRGICRVTDLAATTFAVNWGWGVVSAVNDARAYNRRATAPPGRPLPR